MKTDELTEKGWADASGKMTILAESQGVSVSGVELQAKGTLCIKVLRRNSP